MSGDPLRLYIAVASAVVLPFAFYFDRRNKIARLDKYKKLGFESIHPSDFWNWVHLTHFSIFDTIGGSDSHQQREFIIGKRSGLKIGLFTLFADGLHTVVVLELKDGVPAFVLRPENMGDKVKSIVGRDDIDFPGR